MTADKKVSQAFYFQLGFNIILVLLLWCFTFYAENGFIFTMLLAIIFISVWYASFVFRWLMPFIINYKNMLRSLIIIFLYNTPCFTFVIKHLGYISR